MPPLVGNPERSVLSAGKSFSDFTMCRKYDTPSHDCPLIDRTLNWKPWHPEAVTMRRTLAVIVCVLALAGITSAAAAKDPLLRIGISQIVEHPALDATRQGFMDDLEQK